MHSLCAQQPVCSGARQGFSILPNSFGLRLRKCVDGCYRQSSRRYEQQQSLHNRHLLTKHERQQRVVSGPAMYMQYRENEK